MSSEKLGIYHYKQELLSLFIVVLVSITGIDWSTASSSSSIIKLILI